MFFLLFRNRSRRAAYAYLATLVILLVLVFALHVSGTTLVIVRIARIVLLVAILGAGALLRRRNSAATADSAAHRDRSRD